MASYSMRRFLGSVLRAGGVLALLLCGACGRSERVAPVNASFGFGISGYLGGTTLPLDVNPLLIVKLEAVSAADAGQVVPPLAKAAVPGNLVFDPVRDCGAGTCLVNVPFPVPAELDEDLEIRAFIALLQPDTDAGTNPADFRAELFYGAAILLADDLADGTPVDIVLQPWTSATPPGFVSPPGYTTVNGRPKFSIPMNTECAPLGDITGEPIEGTTIVAYDVTDATDPLDPTDRLSFPLVSINADATSDGSMTIPDGYGFDGMIPVGRDIRLFTFYNGGMSTSFEFYRSGNVMWDYGPDNTHIGAYGWTAPMSVPPGGLTAVDAVIDTCPFRADVQVKFFERRPGAFLNVLSDALILPLSAGSCVDNLLGAVDCKGGSLLAAATLANTYFSIAQCTNLQGGCFFGVPPDSPYPFLNIYAENALDATGGPLVIPVPPAPFDAFEGTYAFPTEVVLFPGGQSLVPETALFSLGLVDPVDPGLTLGIGSAFSDELDSSLCALGGCSIITKQTKLVPGRLNTAEITIVRTPPPVQCGINPLGPALVFLHANSTDSGSNAMDVLYKRTLLPVMGTASCDLVAANPLLAAPFDAVPHWQCPGSFTAGSYQLSVKTNSNSTTSGPSWASLPATYSCPNL